MTRLPVLAATAVAALALVGPAAAEPFGQHVAMCAHQLAARPGAPTFTCSHDGMTMTFDSFGAMVKHMFAMHWSPSR